MKGITKVVLTGVLATLAGTQAWAVSIASCPFDITAPGNYVVATDLTCTGTNVGINIRASNVSLNLNGRIITSTGGFSSYAINVSPPAGQRLNHVGISGPGLIRNFTQGILVDSSDYVQVSLVTVAGNTIVGVLASDVNQLTVGGNVMAQNASAGLMLIRPAGAAVTGNQLVGNGTGIWLVQGSDNVISGNTASGNIANGIEIGGVGVPAAPINTRVSSNTTNGNGGAGIVLRLGASANQIFSNTSSVGNKGNDLQDDNAACDANFWNGNVFFTRNAPCVK